MTPEKASAGLSVFHPVVADWFERQIGEPTEVQSRVWPRIAAGENVLVTAPTGSGKTLAAFLWSLNQLLTGQWRGGRTKVLYVSPLRALNNDIQRNLLAPLGQLESEFEAAGERPEAVRVQTRSGDTPSSERQKMLRRPPEVLITTPESLNILLTSKGGRSILGSVECVILDEIHAVAGGKRGTHLITAVERLGLLAGEFQRIALSATVRPAERIARFVGGFTPAKLGAEGEPIGRPRPVTVIASSEEKQYALSVVARQEAEPSGQQAGVELSKAQPSTAEVWEPLIEGIRGRIQSNRSTLIFANSRRLTEKLTRLLNEAAAVDLAYSHHGSLSREIRAVVEERLKAGRLAALVATNSLELGIDIGALDEVLLVQTPATVASAVQRLGRAGHQVGAPSRGRLYALFDRDLLDAAVMARSVLEQEIEESHPVIGALDVLAQVMLSMVAAEPWDVDELYAFLRSTYPYRELKRRQFDLVLEMLAGRYADSRIRELRPRVTVDRVDNTVRARPGAARLIYQSGGTIPDRGYFHLRLQDSMAKIGELDEEFVWERSVGDTFTLGAQNWQIRGITHNDVLVVPALRSSAMAPFWRAEERNRSFHLASRTGEFLERAEHLLAADEGRAALLRQLGEEHCVEASAAEDLVRLLEHQRAVTGCSLPHRKHLVVERVMDPDPREGRSGMVLHSLWGGKVNRPWALALAAAWEREEGRLLAIEQDNDCLLFSADEPLDIDRLLSLVRPDNVEELLRHSLEKSGFFGARFRENAGRALLLPRASFRHRVPLWLNRQRAKKMLASVHRYEDFPILVETWRTCLQDEFDLESLKLVLGELERGEIRWTEVSTSEASPLAANVLWKQTNRLMYEDDVPEEAEAPGLRRDLLQELVYSSQLRPRLPVALVDRFQRKLHRVYPGYAPQTARDLVDWTRERLVVAAEEWQEMLAAMSRDLGDDEKDLDAILQSASERLVSVRGLHSRESLEAVVHIEDLPRLSRGLGWRPEVVELRSLTAEADADQVGLELARERLAEAWEESVSEVEREESGTQLVDLVAEWLRFYGPVTEQRLTATLGLERAETRQVVEALLEAERIVIDRFRSEEDERLEICDSDNLERLLRLLRAAARPSFEALPLAQLPVFLATQQGLGGAGGDPDLLKTALEGLFGFPAPARLWEAELLPARLDPYYTAWLDALMQETDLVWFGCGRERLSFALRPELDLFPKVGAGEDDSGGRQENRIFKERAGRLGMEEMLRDSGLEPAQLTDLLWSLAWEGKVSNTTFLAVRQAALNQFRGVEVQGSTQRIRPDGPARLRRSRPERWRSATPVPGDWYRVEEPDSDQVEPDALEIEELNRERVRQLLQRYGVLFRELLAHELPALRWGHLSRTLRIMELSGEVLAGHFFGGIPGLQFISPAAYRLLREGLPSDKIFWMGALDPASPCGLGLEDLEGRLPPRRVGSHLVYHGAQLVVVARRQGRELQVEVGPDHPFLRDYLGFLKVLLTRQFDPLHGIAVESINGEPATDSPFVAPLAEMFGVSREPGALRLRRRY
jgi:ATP-dependent Lhr-like helicase